MTRPKHISYIVGTLAIVASSACVDDSSAAQAGGQERTQRQRQQTVRPRPPAGQPATRTPQRDTVRSPQSAISSPGDSVRFVDHPQHIALGRTTPNPSALRLASPFDADPQVKTVGSQLYLSYNCVDCHGMDGSGAMGPSLADGRWRFGGTAGEVFESIYQGRPDGMPAWGGRISDVDIWRLVAYVRSLEVGKDVSTENFTGKAQQRMGH